MKGVILAGGEGTRLRPLTLVTNKHLLPVFDRPMIIHPLETLKSIGANDICIITGGEYMADFMRFLGSGSDLGVNLTYKIQDGALGIAHALLQTENFSNNGKIITILGDNIFEWVSIPPEAFTDDNAYIFLKEMKKPQRFGVPVFDSSGNILKIEEKPAQPKSNFAVTGLYIYPADVFDFIKTLKPSGRGELEITDVNNWYLKQGRLKAIKVDGFWSDSGTLDSLLRATLLRALQKGSPSIGFLDKAETIKNLTDSI
ncbi:MAG: NTP transferase domain-containing protein [Candidatus Aenigmarchaeota archaeon]|nr:NTP transferase domain-containing protein [Candidatus Aenigmarchaeota archaeon]